MIKHHLSATPGCARFLPSRELGGVIWGLLLGSAQQFLQAPQVGARRREPGWPLIAVPAKAPCGKLSELWACSGKGASKGREHSCTCCAPLLHQGRCEGTPLRASLHPQLGASFQVCQGHLLCQDQPGLTAAAPGEGGQREHI